MCAAPPTSHLWSLNESPYEKVGKFQEQIKITVFFVASMKVPTKK